MSKITCNTIKDMLPLYVDEVVSDDTKNIVSEHLANCVECRKKYDSMKKGVSIPIEDNAQPLKQFKSAWKRKKVVLVCATAVVTIAITICTLLVYNHFAYKEEIAVNGGVYTQKGDNISVLPADSMELGYLRSISHKSVDNPTIDFTGTNLDEKYAGCPIYQSAENDAIIYLEDYSGFYIPFEFSEHIAQDEN